MALLVAILGQFVDIDWVGVLARHTAKESILGNVPSNIWHSDVTHLMHLPEASIDGGHIPRLHLGVAYSSVQQVFRHMINTDPTVVHPPSCLLRKPFFQGQLSPPIVLQTSQA